MNEIWICPTCKQFRITAFCGKCGCKKIIPQLPNITYTNEIQQNRKTISFYNEQRGIVLNSFITLEQQIKMFDLSESDPDIKRVRASNDELANALKDFELRFANVVNICDAIWPKVEELRKALDESNILSVYERQIQQVRSGSSDEDQKNKDISAIYSERNTVRESFIKNYPTVYPEYWDLVAPKSKSTWMQSHDPYVWAQMWRSGADIIA